MSCAPSSSTTVSWSVSWWHCHLLVSPSIITIITIIIITRVITHIINQSCNGRRRVMLFKNNNNNQKECTTPMTMIRSNSWRVQPWMCVVSYHHHWEWTMHSCTEWWAVCCSMGVTCWWRDKSSLWTRLWTEQLDYHCTLLHNCWLHVASVPTQRSEQMEWWWSIRLCWRRRNWKPLKIPPKIKHLHPHNKPTTPSTATTNWSKIRNNTLETLAIQQLTNHTPPI